MAPKKKIVVHKEKCKGCELCLSVCPHGVLTISTEVNKRGLPYIIVEHPEKCTGCGQCALICPDLGIEILLEENEN